MCVFTALCSGVYVQCVYGSNKLYTLIVVLVNKKLCVLSYYKAHHLIMYKKQWKQAQNILDKNHASRVGKKKVLKQED